MKQKDADNLIAAYMKEYFRTNGKTIAVTHHKGWFALTTILGDAGKVSGKELVKMLATLQNRPNYNEVREKRLVGGSEMVYVGLSDMNGYQWVPFQARPEDATPAVTGYIAVTKGFGLYSEAEELIEVLNRMLNTNGQ